MLYKLLKTLALPPTSFFVAFFAAWLVKKWRPRLGRILLWALLITVYLCTTPFFAGELMAPLQPYGPVDLDNPDPEVGAIVVLSAGVYSNAAEYWLPGGAPEGPPVAGSLTLERLQYAAHLSRATGKPILATGGPIGDDSEQTIAKAMEHSLEQDFGVTVRWLEEEADRTMTNATYSAALLRDDGIDRIYLVTHAWHMPRAVLAFKAAGLNVVPAPTRFFSRADPLWNDFIPSAQALRGTYYAIHEWLGIAWHHLRA